jgi:hypothetical protein
MSTVAATLAAAAKAATDRRRRRGLLGVEGDFMLLFSRRLDFVEWGASPGPNSGVPVNTDGVTKNAIVSGG